MRTYFITGGTGFVGRAIVRELISREDTDKVVCLTRGRANLIEHPKIGYWKGDVTSFDPPKEHFTDVIHAAAEANDLLAPDKYEYYYTVVEGAKRVFDWVNRVSPDRMLFVSSGAVLKGDTVYCRAKRLSEAIAPECAKIARIYSLVGPEMPLNGQYALGKFIYQALTEKKVRYYESGSVRSYLHVEDCARWLLAILDNGQKRIPYNVGSQDRITVAQLARTVAALADVPCEEVKREDFHDTAQIYVPEVGRTRSLGCEITATLQGAICEVLQSGAKDDHYRNRQ